MERIKGGYILQPRSFDGSSASHFPPCTREVWFFLLRNVNHADNGKFKRGSGFFALEDIQNALSWSVGCRVERYPKYQLVKAIRRLREGNMVATTKATRGVFITVLNYDRYQDPKQYEGNDEGNTKATRRQHEGTHLKQECKNERMKEVKIKSIVTKPAGFDRPDFISEQLWADFIDNRKFKKLQNSPAALKVICKKLREAVDKGFSIEECVGEYISSNWQRFDVEWIANRQKGSNGSGKKTPKTFSQIKDDAVKQAMREWAEEGQG